MLVRRRLAEALAVSPSVEIRVLGSGDHATGHLVLGYRDVLLDLDYDDSGDAVEAEIGASGPYIGLRFLF